ncbi:MAG: ArgR family transcriptional regulator [Acidimicrobiia bacterium]
MATTAARRRIIRQLIQEHRPARQSELVALLAKAGHEVTQATVSRDLDALGAAKAREDDGGHYTLPRPTGTGGLAEIVAEFVHQISASGNLVVLRTPPGAAHMVAGALDRSAFEGILGTVAGDDTVLVVTPAGGDAAAVARRLETMGSS